METTIFENAKNFIDFFNDSLVLDFKELERLLNEVNSSNLKYNNCSITSNVSFVDNSSIDVVSISNDKDILLNKTRVVTIHRLSIDCNNTFHKTWIDTFYQEKTHNPTFSNEDRLLYDFIDKNLKYGEPSKISKIGSMRTTSYELLEAIFSEGRRILERQYLKGVFSGLESPPEALDQKMLLFASTFEFLEKSLKQNELVAPKGINPFENPTELDTKYNSFWALNNIRETYFPFDNMICLHFLNSNILEPNISAEETAINTFKNYTRVYRKYSNSIQDSANISPLHNFIIANKDKIISALTLRISEIQHIIEISKERLNALNDPNLIY